MQPAPYRVNEQWDEPSKVMDTKSTKDEQENEAADLVRDL